MSCVIMIQFAIIWHLQALLRPFGIVMYLYRNGVKQIIYALELGKVIGVIERSFLEDFRLFGHEVA